MNYRVCLTTKVNPKTLKKGSGIMVLEPDDYTKTAIAKIKTKGYKVLGYISVGTLEKERPWYKKYKHLALKTLEDWPKECYVDVREKEWRDFLVSRAKDIKAKGFNGWWGDNLDVYEYYKSGKMFASLQASLSRIKKLGGYIMVNGGSEFFDYALDHKRKISWVDGVTQEEVFSLITSYSGKGKFSKQKKSQREFYQKLLKRLKKAGKDIFLLEYATNKTLKATIRTYCKLNGYSHYISEEVDL